MGFGLSTLSELFLLLLITHQCGQHDDDKANFTDVEAEAGVEQLAENPQIGKGRARA